MQDIHVRLGVRLRELRHRRSYTIEELAHKSGLNPAYIGKVERGEKNFTVDTLDKLVRALNFSYAELYDFANTVWSPDIDSPLVAKTVDYLSALAPREQELVCETARTLALHRNSKRQKTLP